MRDARSRFRISGCLAIQAEGDASARLGARGQCPGVVVKDIGASVCGGSPEPHNATWSGALSVCLVA